ncbi:RtcB family protein [Clostridium sp. MD294]|uniref:RtcB family protein n=1 Tax=Clostridium sp. MD294 TaxID=97138 RepID=UPI0002C8BAF6|nr:RtcB family protein [Clostridium sp. MD294]USF30029.1 RNA-splicing ligase RtcB [Clostridium sp. MD294]
MKIIGKQNEAIVYGNTIEDSAIEQIQMLCDQVFIKHSKIRIMPDVHTGAGCTIGMTMTISDKVVPNIVGVDIGCGMYTVCLGKIEIDFEKLDAVVHTIPSGKNVWEGKQKQFDLTVLNCYRSLKDTKRIMRSIGTLGGGNHFIEIEKTKDNVKYMVIHTGSRNLGKQVANYYQDMAIDLQKGKEEYFQKKEQMIAQYKAEGRRKELQKALKEITWIPKELEMPEDLCFLYGKYMQQYLQDIEICQQFAVQNRELIAQKIIEGMNWKVEEAFHTIHNYIDVEENIVRKGAISAKKGEKVLIPINMKEGSILAIGKGNEEWNYSAPHGAGRLFSRSQAKECFTLEQYQKEMEGIYTTCVTEKTLDESPMAYKKLEDIINAVQQTVDVVEVMKPMYNFKAE